MDDLQKIVSEIVARSYFELIDDFEDYGTFMTILVKILKDDHEPFKGIGYIAVIRIFAKSLTLLKRFDKDDPNHAVLAHMGRLARIKVAKAMMTDTKRLSKAEFIKQSDGHIRPCDLPELPDWFLHIDSQSVFNKEYRTGHLVSPQLVQVSDYYRVSGPVLIKHALKDEDVLELHEEALVLKHDAERWRARFPEDEYDRASILFFLCCLIQDTEEGTIDED